MDWLRAITMSLGQLAFADTRLSGLLVLASLGFISPWMALGALTGAALGCAAARLLGTYARSEWLGGLAGFNSAILGVMACGFLSAGPSVHWPALVAAGLTCWLIEAPLRRFAAGLGLPALALPAMVVAVLFGLALAPPGGWWWTSVLEADLPVEMKAAAGLSVLIAMGWRNLEATGWAVTATLCCVAGLQLAGCSLSEHAWLWTVIVPVTAFAIASEFMPSGPGRLISLAAGLFMAVLLWSVWRFPPLTDLMPALLFPVILGIWTAISVHTRVARHPILSRSFASALGSAYRAWRSPEGLFVFLVARSGEQNVLIKSFLATPSGEAVTTGNATDLFAEGLSNPRHDQLAWELADRLKRFEADPHVIEVAQAIARFQRTGKATRVASSDLGDTLDNAGTAGLFRLSGGASKVRCLACGEPASWPPARLWRRMAIQCRTCGGLLAPDVRLLPGGEGSDDADIAAFTTAIKPPAVIFSTGRMEDDDPAASLREQFAARGIAVFHFEQARNGETTSAKVVRMALPRFLRLFDRLMRLHACLKTPLIWLAARRAQPAGLRRTGMLAGQIAQFARPAWLAAAPLGLMAGWLMANPQIAPLLPARLALTGVSPLGVHNIVIDGFDADLAGIEKGRIRGNPVRLQADLILPESSGKPVPAVVVLHGSLGLSGAQYRLARHLKDAGIATLILKSFVSRNVANVVGKQELVQTYSMLIDAYQGLEWLARDPRFDRQRIAVAGWSKGGVAAHRAATRFAADLLGNNLPPFAGHVAVNPWCGEQEVDIEMTGAPLTILIADHDDWVSAQACRDYAERAAAAGFPVKHITYRSAEHGFDEQGKFRLHVPAAVNWTRCNYFVRKDGFVIAATGEFRRWHALQAFADACSQRGGHIATNSAMRTRSVVEISNFLKIALRD